MRMKRHTVTKAAHIEAVIAFVKRKTEGYRRDLFANISRVMTVSGTFEDMSARDDWSWLSDFILADVKTLKQMIGRPELLQFNEFKRMYSDYFSAGSDKYVDASTKYNAYTFIENLGVTICPYCDEEYLDVVENGNGGKLRTLEIDHFFPKGKYPALAMCFYNLVPSGQNCNGMKREELLGMNPYEEGIEGCTWLYPDLPVGVNMEKVPVADCTIHFHPRAGMEKNVKALHLEERYERHKATAHKYLLLRQQYDDAKVEEMVKMGMFPTKDFAYRVLYGEPLDEEAEEGILRKLSTAPTGDHRRFHSHKAFDQICLQLPEIWFPLLLKNIRDRHPLILHDHLIHLHLPRPGHLRQARCVCTLPAAHKSDQKNMFLQSRHNLNSPFRTNSLSKSLTVFSYIQNTFPLSCVI